MPTSRDGTLPTTLTAAIVLLLLSPFCCSEIGVNVQTTGDFLETIAADSHASFVNIRSSISLRYTNFTKLQRRNLTVAAETLKTPGHVGWISINIDAGQHSAPYAPRNATCNLELRGLILSNVCFGIIRTGERVSRPNVDVFLNTLAGNAGPWPPRDAPRWCTPGKEQRML